MVSLDKPRTDGPSATRHLKVKGRLADFKYDGRTVVVDARNEDDANRELDGLLDGVTLLHSTSVPPIFVSKG